MARTRRSRRKKLRPSLPEERALIKPPRYFGIIRGAGSKKKELEVPLPPMMPRTKKIPTPIPSVGRGGARNKRIRMPMPRSEKIPLIVRVGRGIRSLRRRIETGKPVAIPKFPKLDYPKLYRRYPTIKTETKTTGSNGKISCTFRRPFKKIPGVVITPKSGDSIAANVTNVTLTGFDAIFFNAKHSHGGTVNDNGAHTPGINADGTHVHDIEGSIEYTNSYKNGYVAKYWKSDDNSSAGDPHHHEIAHDFQYAHFMYEMVIDEFQLWISEVEDPAHAHSGVYVSAHDHDVAEDGGALLKNTSVTVTYLAQEEEEE